MSDYKLVPVEPTPKMLQVWKSMYGYSRYDKYKAMLAAAPAVQGEPVAFCEDAALSIAERTFSTDVDEQLASDIIQYAQRLHSLYTAPQPVEQQLDLHLFAKRMDEELEKHDIQGFEPVVLAVAEEVLGYGQQPAPDVSALVEALGWLRGAINATPENDKVQAGIWISSEHPRIKQIDAILAAYRKQGGEP